MPIIGTSPWREQYFTGIHCPPEVVIPTDDPEVWDLYPTHRWVYNKVLVCESQGIPCGPHGSPVPEFPVFSKPITNLQGMGLGSRILADRQEYELAITPGHMWMQLLRGEQVSSDAIVIDGSPCWWRHTVGMPLKGGMFDYWKILAEARPGIEEHCRLWLERHLRGYTGAVNIETIGGLIIECHLRFSDQWPDLYGEGWVESAIGVYADRGWQFVEGERRNAYSVVLFGQHGRVYRIDRAAAHRVARRPGVSSLQITFHDGRAPALHPMPPGGFRLAIINCWDLEIGRTVRDQLAGMFESKAI